MNVEIIEVKLGGINRKTTGGQCFHATDYVKNALCLMKQIQGLAIITEGDKKVVCRFSFSGLGMDGDVFVDDVKLGSEDYDRYSSFIKHYIPIYCRHFKEL